MQIDLFGNKINEKTLNIDYKKIKNKIILLDLNYTLISNSDKCFGAYPRRIYKQKYEKELIDVIKNNYVILITARPITYKEETLRHLKKLTNFEPDDSYWNFEKNKGDMQPHKLKEYWLEKEIFKKYGDNPNLYFAIESNKLTRKMYHKKGINAISKQKLFNII